MEATRRMIIMFSVELLRRSCVMLVSKSKSFMIVLRQDSRRHQMNFVNFVMVGSDFFDFLKARCQLNLSN